jgi:hypothetical protein
MLQVVINILVHHESCITFIHTYVHTYIHTYHSRFLPKGVADASQIFLRDAYVLPKLFEEYLPPFLIGYE